MYWVCNLLIIITLQVDDYKISIKVERTQNGHNFDSFVVVN